eukprot:TRINITY_DN17490_c0_g1_i1.p1 TRINITY_DN17490_c0_g1~~TRINITY_DN17490_c0_g1_i1.p1  ORF type:complete len:88 (-),score=3.87 TRINITY_DN17490_c0_g1_i1:72-335(-)
MNGGRGGYLSVVSPHVLLDFLFIFFAPKRWRPFPLPPLYSLNCLTPRLSAGRAAVLLAHLYAVSTAFLFHNKCGARRLSLLLRLTAA